jgi:hypothetical protein
VRTPIYLGRGCLSQVGPAARDSGQLRRETGAAVEARIVYLLSKTWR